MAQTEKVGRQGFEPWTPGLKVRCSDQAELTALNVGKLLYGTHPLAFNAALAVWSIALAIGGGIMGERGGRPRGTPLRGKGLGE